MKNKLLNGNYLMVDETPISILNKDKPGATYRGYSWVNYNTVKQLVFFNYRKGCGREGQEELLKDYRGALQADGYSVYEAFEKQPV